jgi:hypothetical protein
MDIITCKHNPTLGDHCYTCAADEATKDTRGRQMREAAIMLDGFRRAEQAGKELAFFDQLTAYLRMEEPQTRRAVKEVLDLIGV